jgi:DNA-binding ferritin-like protein
MIIESDLRRLIVMKLAKNYLEQIIQHSQQAIKLLDQGEKRLAVGIIDEIKDKHEAAKWILINEIIEKEGKF